MRKGLMVIIFPLFVLFLIAGCTTEPQPATQPGTPPTTQPSYTAPTVPSTEPVVPEHSALYIPGVSTEDVIAYFQEVCLDAEIINAGDPTKLQRWETPIRFICYGSCTDADRQVLDSFVAWLNTVKGFPGMQETQMLEQANLQIYFCDQSEYLTRMGDKYLGTDGGVTFWYNDNDEIYEAIIAYRTDLDQQLRNSVILEEIYNGLGPINDTRLRPDSIIYADFSIPQALSPVDELILKLLYHPQMQCSMDADACEAVIRQLYY